MWCNRALPNDKPQCCRSMVPVKIECGCGQHYAFDVDPVNGRMPTSVACPECGMDGTDAANDGIAQYLAAQSTPASGTTLQVVAAPPAPSAPPPPIPAAPRQRLPVKPITPQKHDGWGSPETSFNKLGTYLMAGSSVLAALTAWGMFGIEVSGTILCVVVGVCGVVGGAINLAGRGPILAGMIVGPIIGSVDSARPFGGCKAARVFARLKSPWHFLPAPRPASSSSISFKSG